MNCMVAGIKNHNCLESDIFPATDSFITFRSINSFRLESGNMEKIIIDTIIDYYVNKRLNSTEISNILGIKNTAILHQLKKNGIPRRDSNKYRMEKIYTKELIDVIVDYYVNKQLNSTEISNILGIKKAAILHQLNKNGIPRRDTNKQRIGKKRKPFTKEHCERMSISKKGKFTLAQARGMRERRDFHGENNPFYGKKHTTDSLAKIKNTKIMQGTWQQYGDKNPNWNGGLVPERDIFRRRIEFKEWRRKVFERDHFTCQNCGVAGCRKHKLNAHHIRPAAKYLELRLEINNGITLCEDCHNEVEKAIRSGLQYRGALIANLVRLSKNEDDSIEDYQHIILQELPGKKRRCTFQPSAKSELIPEYPDVKR